MTDIEFPRPDDAPEELKKLTANCGLLCAWQVLTYFGRCPGAEDLVRSCRYDPNVGVFGVGLAAALATSGLAVTYYSDLDPEPTAAERELDAIARIHDVRFMPGADLFELDRAIRDRSARTAAVILYEAPDDTAHFTPFLGLYNGELIVPNEGDGLVIDEIELRRSAKGIFRQTSVARLPAQPR